MAELLKDTRDGKNNNRGFPKNKAFTKHIKEFLEEANKVTTDYFEAKPARNVTFDEFSGAVVPKETPKETVDFLESQGLEVVKYNQGTVGDRKAKTKKLATKKGAYFQEQEGMYAGQYSEAENLITHSRLVSVNIFHKIVFILPSIKMPYRKEASTWRRFVPRCNLRA